MDKIFMLCVISHRNTLAAMALPSHNLTPKSQLCNCGKRARLASCESLEIGQPEAIGPLLWQSHVGLRDDYEVSCLELDALIGIAQQVPSALGARMMGGGFGGYTINLVQVEAVEALHKAIDQQYPALTGQQAKLNIYHPSGGPGAGWTANH